jgi:N-acetylmuramoyl-L-alanine amidase.
MTVLVTRSQWGARPRKQGTNNLVDHPQITIHYEGEGWQWPWDHSTCDDKVRAMQDYHMNSRGWSDIAYNYLACPHDFLFEGRGFDHQSAANGYESANEQSYALQAMWGSKAGVKVPDNLKRALLFGIQVLRTHGTHRANSVIKGHRDWKSTDCPGDELYAWIKAGCPTPDKTIPSTDTSKDFDVATVADLRQAIKLEAERGGSIYATVQAFSGWNAENLRQRIDDIANAAARAVDASLQDDFTGVEAAVNAAKAEINKLEEQHKVTPTT